MTCDFCDEEICRCAGEEVVDTCEEVPTLPVIGKGCTSDCIDESCGQCCEDAVVDVDYSNNATTGWRPEPPKKKGVETPKGS